MKPTTTTKKQSSLPSPHFISPTLPQRVPVVFLPSVGWPIAIGRVPAKAFAAPQTLRDNKTPSGYKRAHGSSQPPAVFVPVGLMMDAEKQQQATSRRLECRVTPKLPVNL